MSYRKVGLTKGACLCTWLLTFLIAFNFDLIKWNITFSNPNKPRQFRKPGFETNMTRFLKSRGSTPNRTSGRDALNGERSGIDSDKVELEYQVRGQARNAVAHPNLFQIPFLPSPDRPRSLVSVHHFEVIRLPISATLFGAAPERGKRLGVKNRRRKIGSFFP